MQLVQLRYFLSVIEHGSFSAAARAVNLAQPAFSRHIRALEQYLGVTLFKRSVQGAQLTGAGRRLKDRASSILRRVEQVCCEVSTEGNKPVGEVRLALSASMTPLLSGKVFWSAIRNYPKVNLKIFDVNRVVSGHLVETGQVDFALLSNVASMDDVSSEAAFEQSLYLIGSSIENTDCDTVNLEELRRFPLVMEGRDHHHRIELEQAAARLGYMLNIAYEQDSIPIIRSLLFSGPIFTVVPYSTFAEEISDGRLMAREVTSPQIKRILSFAWQKNTELSSAAKCVKRLVQRSLSDMVESEGLKGRVINFDSL